MPWRAILFSRLTIGRGRGSQGRRDRGFHSASEHLADTGGFSLIEILVAFVIFGIVVAVALPALATQRQRAVDVQAQEIARSAETAAETVAVDDHGAYETVTATELHRAEPTIPIAAGAHGAYLSTTTHGEDEYSVTARATNGNEYTSTRASNGEVARQCASPILKTSCAGTERGTW